jgi:hypothetical protein
MLRRAARARVFRGQFRHPEAQWGYLKNGVMIDFPKYGLIHYVDPDDDLVLVARVT